MAGAYAAGTTAQVRQHVRKEVDKHGADEENLCAAGNQGSRDNNSDIPAGWFSVHVSCHLIPCL